MRRPWMKPQLIVLERGSAEENVLQVCKCVSLRGPKDRLMNCKFVQCGNLVDCFEQEIS